MRAYLLALAAVAVTQPAFARDHSHKSSHQIAQHHVQGHHHGARYHRTHAGIVRVRAPIESGYSMPQFFARTDATDTDFRPAWAMVTQQVSGPAEPRTGRTVGAAGRDSALDAMIARHAAANGLPVDLVHRVVIRESRYNPRASNRGALGLMQIKHPTARGIGYTGPASGLFDPETNLTYAVRYLAGAYRAAGGNASRAVAYYASGYHGRGLAARAPRVMTAEASVPFAVVLPAPVMRDTDVAMPAYTAPTRRTGRIVSP